MSLGGGGERIIKDLKRKANSLSRDTRQANALGLEEEEEEEEEGLYLRTETRRRVQTNGES